MKARAIPCPAYKGRGTQPRPPGTFRLANVPGLCERCGGTMRIAMPPCYDLRNREKHRIGEDGFCIACGRAPEFMFDVPPAADYLC